jgi:hypothetical protein
VGSRTASVTHLIHDDCDLTGHGHGGLADGKRDEAEQHVVEGGPAVVGP